MKKLLMLSLLVVLLLVGCGKKEAKLSSIVVSFNPEFLVSFDENKIVKEIKALNDDSKIYLTEELINLKVNEFVEHFVEVSQENGYLENTDVEITVKSYEGDNKEVIEQIKNNLEIEHKMAVKEEVIAEEEKERIAVVAEQAPKIEYKEPTAEEAKKLEEEKKAEEQKKVEEEKKAEEAKKLEEEKKAEATSKYDYNLNKTNKLESEMFTTLEYVYPQNSECVGKDPWGITLPEGANYNTYCQNKIPSFKTVVKGKGYYCEYSGNNTSDTVSISGEYECTALTKIVKSSTVSNMINKIVKVNNAYPVAGGRGGSDTITLTAELCSKYSLSCGKW